MNTSLMSVHTVDVHNKFGSFAVCFEKLGPKIVGRCWTVAKLDRGAPQIRYVHPEYPGALIGPSKQTPMVVEAVTTAAQVLAKEGWRGVPA